MNLCYCEINSGVPEFQKKIFVCNIGSSDWNVMRIPWFACLLTQVCVCVCLCVVYEGVILCSVHTCIFLIFCASLSTEYCNNYEAHLILYETTEVPFLQQ